MRSLIIVLALASLVLMGAKPAWAGQTEPYLTLDTPGPYHYGGTIQTTTHGDIHHESRLQMFCSQNGTVIYVESVDASVTETAYTLHFGWTDKGGGAADCQIRFGRVGSVGKSYERYTVIDIHVEA